MQRCTRQRARILAAAVGALAFTSLTFGKTVTWTGAVVDPDSATYTDASAEAEDGGLVDNTPFYAWTNGSGANWSGGNYAVGDDVVFTDNFAGGAVVRMTSSSLNPRAMTFTDAGAGAVTYYFLRSGDFLDVNAVGVSGNTPFGAANPSTVITLDTGFDGKVVFRPRANSGALNGLTIIRSGTLEIQDALALPGTTSTNSPAVILAGGTFAVNISSAGNFQPASSNLTGSLAVVADSTLSQNRDATTAAGAAVGSARIWNGPMLFPDPSRTLTLVNGAIADANPAVRVDLAANSLAFATGTFKLVDGPNNNTTVRLGGAAGFNATFDVGVGSSILESTSSGTQAIGALSGGSANTIVRGSNNTLAIGGKNVNATYSGQITDNVAAASITNIAKVGSGVQTLSGDLSVAGSFTGTTTVAGGTLRLDYTINSTKLADVAALNLGGGALELSGGSHVEVVASTNVNAGASAVVQTGGTSTLRMNTLARPAVGGTVNIAAAGIADTDTSNDATGIIGSYAVVGGADWAVSAAAAADTPITAYSGYVAMAASGSDTNNSLLTGSGVLTGSLTTYSLKVTTTAAGQSLDIGAGNTLTLSSGGVLLTGADAYAINNGSLQGAASADLVVHNNLGGKLTIGSTVIDNTATTALTISGGTTVLTASNLYTGPTYVNNGTIEISANAQLGASTTVPGDPPVTTFAPLYLNGGKLVATGNLALDDGGAPAVNRNIVLGAGTGGTIDTGANTVTINGVISGSGVNGSNVGGALVKEGSGTLILGGANTYNGGTIIKQGTISITAANNLGGTVGGAGFLTLDGGRLEVTASAEMNTARFVRVLTTGTIHVNGPAGQTNALRLDQPVVIEAGGTLTKTGDGDLSLSTTTTARQAHGVGATLRISGGTVNMENDAGAGGSTLTVIVDPGLSVNLAASQRLYALNLTGNGSLARVGQSRAGAATVGHLMPITLSASGGGTSEVTTTQAGNFISPAGSIDVAASTTLNLTGSGAFALDPGTVTKTGPGTLNVGVVGAHRAGATFNVTAGPVNVNANQGTAVNLGGDTLPNTGDETAAVANLTLSSSGGVTTLGSNQILWDMTASVAGGINLAGYSTQVYNLSAEAALNADVGTGRIIDSTALAVHQIGITDQKFDEFGLSGTQHILVKVTRKGDANLDGTTNFNDLLRLSQNYNQSSKLFDDADFTYDGTVNFNDLLILSQNYNQSYPSAAPAAVPEPGILGLLGLGALGVLGRRRRG